MADTAPAKPHMAGILAALTSIVGIALPLASALPPKYGAVITAAGVLLQAFTKPVQAGSTDLVPKQ